MERLLNFNISDDEFLPLLEQTVSLLYSSVDSSQRNAAQSTLTQLKEHPDSWIRVDKILDRSNDPNVKFFALQILENLIKYRWKTLPRGTCEAIRNYIVNKVIELSSSDEYLSREKVYIGKLDLILVQVVKQEWPANWRSFVSDIVGASKSSMSLCENNLYILQLLSEEVFDFSREFLSVYQLCQLVFDQAAELQRSRPSLISTALKTFERFLSWIPLGYVFETQVIESLLSFFGQSRFRNEALRCLVEVATIQVEAYHDKLRFLFVTFMEELCRIIPPETDIASLVDKSGEISMEFISNLALFFSEFFKSHVRLLEDNGSNGLALLLGMEYLVKISMVPDTEVFKICLEWWRKLASEIYNAQYPIEKGTSSIVLLFNNRQVANERLQFYAPIFSSIRRVMISRMAKPEEVLIVEDENGEIVRETTKDTDTIALYIAMKETIWCLCLFDPVDTMNIMLEKLSLQLSGTEWSWHNINTLCWAIGSISDALSEQEERKFLVTVIKDLLHLCEMKRGKDNKAVVASNIMYVVGQYPRFLQAHWKFLKTVVNKLFEFMHETHPGVQDMACDTFRKIVQDCHYQFVVTQYGETKPFIMEIIENLQDIISDLEPHQVQALYPALSRIVAAFPNAEMKNQLVLELFHLPNTSWESILYQASREQQILQQRDVMKRLVSILRTNSGAATHLGSLYMIQLRRIFSELMSCYSVYSEMIIQAIGNLGVFATKTADVRLMRSVKKELLKLLESFFDVVDKSERKTVETEFIQPLLEPILSDYFRNIPEAREPETLSLFAVITTYMGEMIPVTMVRYIFKSLFNVTLEMIKNNFEDFPDSRYNLFRLLRAINQYSFASLFQLDEDPSLAESEFRLVINAILWAVKHTERNIAETGLQTLLELLKNVDSSSYEGYFYRTYFQLILNDILVVLTDTLHRPGFKYHVQILLRLFTVVNGYLKEPIWTEEEATQASRSGVVLQNNYDYVNWYLRVLLMSAFPNMSRSQIENVIQGMLQAQDEKILKNHLRDFLIQTKEFSSGDNSELYDEANHHSTSASEQERLQSSIVPTSSLQQASNNSSSSNMVQAAGFGINSNE
ncbi:Protein EXPORTIN 1A [Galdieria sulphuraria]|nr:Protein EXPORTIN 1A [Galdieria sulphuraria]